MPRTTAMKHTSLGKCLMKQRIQQVGRVNSRSHLHTYSDPADSESALDSITQQTDLADFMTRVALSEKNYEARQIDIKILTTEEAGGVLSDAEKSLISRTQAHHINNLRIPRRPAWTTSTTPEELHESESIIFASWRVELSKLATVDNLTITPYEKNQQVWKQLWRVVERSDVVVQIVDARNPLLFRCTDLERYVIEVDAAKKNLLLINKADFLTDQQREDWAEYFRKEGIYAVFFSALVETEEFDKKEGEGKITEERINKNWPLSEGLFDVEEEDEEEEEEEDEEGQKDEGIIEDDAEESGQDLDSSNNSLDPDVCLEECKKDLEHFNLMYTKTKQDDQSENCIASETNTFKDQPIHDKGNDITSNPIDNKENECVPNDFTTKPTQAATTTPSYTTISKLYNREELIELLSNYCPTRRLLQTYVTIGLVGYPNVGKSSTINCLMREKKVTVSSTPGKTKHFQTLYLSPDVVLCDCPGLVFPGFVNTRQEMIIWGILSIDRIRRDYDTAINLLCNEVPPETLELAYSVPLPAGNTRKPTPEELLSAHAVTRSYMSARGRPDTSRSARVILKDFTSGRLLHCVAPPGADQDSFHRCTAQAKVKNRVKLTPGQENMMPETPALVTAHLDKLFGLSVVEDKVVEPRGKQPRKLRVKKPKGLIEVKENSDGTLEYIITKPWRNKPKDKVRQGKKNPNTNDPYGEQIW